MIYLASYRERNRKLIRAKGAAYRKQYPEKAYKAKRLHYAKNPVARLLAYARRSAGVRGLVFQITLNDITPLPVKCPVLGIPLDYAAFDGPKKKARFNSPSVDRIDNMKGYIPGNVVVISWRANRLKSDGTPEELMRVARYATQASRKRANGSQMLSQQEALYI